MKTGLALLASLLLIGSTLAQPAPFDMSPEADLRIEGVSSDVVETVPAPVAPQLIRHVVLKKDVRLSGETDQHSYVIFLTAAQAAASATLQLGYLNALVVAPETSRLRIQINGTTVLNTPISSSAQIGEIAAEIPEGVLNPGFNTVLIRADQRHRTDCDVNSTYELWSEVDGAQTYLAFAGEGLGKLSRLGDLAAVGVDADGATTIKLIMPEDNAVQHGALAADLVQGLAADLRTPNVRVEYSAEFSPKAGSGVLNVVLATADTLPAAAGSLADEAAAGAVAAFAGDAANTLIVSGPDWTAVAEAIETVRIVAQQYPRFENALPPLADRAQPVPILTGNSVVTLSSLGVEAFSFNGRRYHTDFDIALPPDFFSNRYGEAELRFNAAYSGEIQPGSQIEVFVNGMIASVTPILRTDDALRDLLIKIPMLGFRPGVNKVELVVSLRTQADDLCAPGTVTVGSEQRLLVSGESEFVMPEFARIAQLPNLAAFAGTSFPYAEASGVDLVVGGDDDSISAALTLLARMAVQTDTKISVASVSLSSPAPTSDAIFVGGYSQLPPDATTRLGVLRPYANATGGATQANDVDSVLQRWRSTGRSNSTNIISRAQHWVADLLNLGPNSLGIFPASDAAYAPLQTDQALVIQRLQPEGGLWTMLTVPDQAAVVAGVDAISTDGRWRELSGRVSVLAEDGAGITTVEPNEVTFLETTAIAPQNLRLIAANWLSSHVLAYALLLGLFVIGLTLATAGVLRTFGRRP